MNIGIYTLKVYNTNSKATSKQNLRLKKQLYLIIQEDILTMWNDTEEGKKIRKKNKWTNTIKTRKMIDLNIIFNNHIKCIVNPHYLRILYLQICVLTNIYL